MNANGSLCKNAALLSERNIGALQNNAYEYILGARLKNESEKIKERILALEVKENKPKELKTEKGRLVVS